MRKDHRSRNLSLRLGILWFFSIVLFFLIGRWSLPSESHQSFPDGISEGSELSRSTGQHPSEVGRDNLRRLAVRAMAHRASVAQTSARDDTETSELREREYRRQQAEEFLERCLDQLDRYVSLRHLHSSPASIVNEQSKYMYGAIEALSVLAPELTEELADSIEEKICSEDADDTLLMYFASMGAVLPETMSSKSLECMFDKHKQEDEVLWGAIDAWRSTRLPKTAAIQAAEERATDPRTIRRFRDTIDGQEMLVRDTSDRLDEIAENVGVQVEENIAVGAPPIAN